MADAGPSIFDVIAAGLAVVAAGEIFAARFFAAQSRPQSKLIASLLFWEGVAMFACAAVLYARQDFDVSTIVGLVAIWMAGAGVGLLRAGVFDTPRE